MRRGTALIVAGLALLAGCGGSDSGEEEYVERVDALCKRANPDLAAIQTGLLQARNRARAGQASTAATLDEFERLLAEADSVTRRLLTELRGADPPESESEFHDDLVRSVERGAENVELQLGAARRGDPARLRALSIEGSRLNSETRALILEHGDFDSCGRGLG